ncbi:unnamed protein product [Rotaria sordida]|uniref:Uncharacterized protein n=1 Tax=Rotaria sordida TaxID=392033 RepID=A0A813WYF1_9BILA|nr:unnamed protein product [Rotaria sordida]
MNLGSQLSSKPRIVKLSRHRSAKISTAHIRPNTIIRTTIGSSNRPSITSNQIRPIITDNSNERSKNKRYSISVNKIKRSGHSYPQSSRSRLESDNEKNHSQQQNNDSTHISERKNTPEKNLDRIFLSAKKDQDQNITRDAWSSDSRSYSKSADRWPSQMNFKNESREELNKGNRKKREKGAQQRSQPLSAVRQLRQQQRQPPPAVRQLKQQPTQPLSAVQQQIQPLPAVQQLRQQQIQPPPAVPQLRQQQIQPPPAVRQLRQQQRQPPPARRLVLPQPPPPARGLVLPQPPPPARRLVLPQPPPPARDAPTGIYALQIPSCATWNKTGITVAGNANATPGSDAASLNAPVGIFLDNNYTLYISDRDNHRIVKYVVNATTGVVVAGTGTAGNSASQLRSPKGVAVDQMSAIIVADGANFRIQRFPFGSTVGTTVAINSSANLIGDMRDLHIDVNNNIYVTDSDYSRVVKFFPDNGIGVILAGNSGAGSAAHQLQGSYGNFIDGNDTLYVADSGNHRVQMWPAGATNGTTIAGITSTTGTGLLRLKSPMQVIVDNNGYYYIADSGNNRIVKWTSNYAAGGTCIAGCTGSAGNASNQLNTPRDLKFDASGNLYVSDRDNNRVQKFMLEIPANCSISG